jgi:uncharacterized membrane protein
MEKMLAIVFDTEKAAYEGARALLALDGEGSIALNSRAVIKKNADGTVSQLRVDDDIPVRTLTGTALGSLIGILGGPVGIAVGMSTGTLIGLIGDIRVSEVDTDFLTDVSTALTPGKCAVLADLDEEWVTPLDTRMEALGGAVYRTIKSAVEDDRRARETAAWRAEIDQLKAEHAKASSDRKAKLQAKIDQLRTRLEKKIEEDRARSKQAAAQMQSRVEALQKKAQHEKGAAKAAIEARIAHLRSDLQRQQRA